MQCQSGLTILVSGEVLGHGRGNGLVARNDALYQAAHGFNAQGQRNDIEQEQIAGRVIACQLIGLNGGAQGHHFIGVQIVQRWLAKESGHGFLHLGHARRPAHHDHALNVFCFDLGIAQCFFNSRHAPCCQRQGCFVELRARHFHFVALGCM